MFYSLKTFHKCEGTKASCLRGSALNVILNVAAEFEPSASVSMAHYAYTLWQQKPEFRSVGDTLAAYRSFVNGQKYCLEVTQLPPLLSIFSFVLYSNGKGDPSLVHKIKAVKCIYLRKIFTCLPKSSDLEL